MTFQVLQQNQTEHSVSEPYVSRGTDEAEYNQWLAVQGLEAETDDGDIESDRHELFGPV